MTESEVLRQPFDIATHKQYFVDYLEVMIAPDGTIEYAVPSHQEYLINKATQRRNCTREELYAACPREYYCDFLTWLIGESGGYIPVWRNQVYAPSATSQQRAALKKLKVFGLYKGPLLKKAETSS